MVSIITYGDGWTLSYICKSPSCHGYRKRRMLMIRFSLCLGILIRLISYMGRAKIRLNYHWAELWRCLLSFIKFLGTYPNDIKTLPKSATVVNMLVNLNTLALSSGETFLPDAASYDDLFYKLVEAGDILIKFRDTYEKELVNPKNGAIDTLISVSRHYHAILEENSKGRRANKHLTAQQVHKAIQQGYETLSIKAKEDLVQWEKFRETDHKAVVKKAARLVVEDAKVLIGVK